MKVNLALVGLVLLIFFVISFLTNILGALNPSVSESYLLSDTMVSFLPFTFFIAYGVMSIPAGFLVERWGEKRVIISAFVLALLGALLFVLFTTFPVFLITLFLIGSAMASLQVVINPLLRVAGGEENYAFYSVCAQLVFGAASFVSPLVFSWLVVALRQTEKSSFITFIDQLTPDIFLWSAIYWIFILLLAAVLLAIILFPFPKVVLNEEEKVGTASSYVSLFKDRLVIAYFFGIFAYVGLEQGISFWMSKFLEVYHGMDHETIGAVAVGNFWGLMTIGGIVGLIVIKLVDSKIVLRAFSFLALVSLVLALSLGPEQSRLAFQASGFFLSVMYPVIISLALNSVKEHHGSFAGILMAGIMGGAVVQLLIGVLSDLTSLKIGMLLNFVALGYIISISYWSQPLVKNKTIKL